MPNWSKEEYRAIQNYATTHNYKITLSVNPTANFIDKNNEEVNVHITEVLRQYRTSKKEEANEKRRVKVEEERKNRLGAITYTTKKVL